MSFRIYPAMNTPKDSNLWASGDMTLQVSQGQFSINLGDTVGIPPKIPAQPAFPADLFKDDTRYLGITVDGSELVDRKKLVSVPYAMSAGSGGIPKGLIAMWSGSTVPEGWALCDGQNGTPDLRNKFIVGAGTSYLLGNTGGEATHTLTIDEMPTHTHIQNAHTHIQDAHNHALSSGWSENASNASLVMSDEGNDGKRTNYSQNTTATNQNTVATNQNTGGGGAHNNLPPYYALAYIMKL
ncbi:MAG: tail fiber protein [Desulfatirhabdiaceae bacterium]